MEVLGYCFLGIICAGLGALVASIFWSDKVSEIEKELINRKRYYNEELKWVDITFGYKRVIIEKRVRGTGELTTTIINQGDIK